MTTFLLFFKPGIISSWVSQGFDIHCLRFFFIMSSLKKTKSLGSSNKGRFHHNKPRICNLLNRENSERLDQTEGKSKATHTAQVTVSLHAGPPHLFPANLEASWGAAEPAPHLVLPREDPPTPPSLLLPVHPCSSHPHQLQAVAPLHFHVPPSLGGFLQFMLKSQGQLTILSLLIALSFWPPSSPFLYTKTLPKVKT